MLKVTHVQYEAQEERARDHRLGWGTSFMPWPLVCATQDGDQTVNWTTDSNAGSEKHVHWAEAWLTYIIRT